MIYCVIPPELEDELLDKLTEYYKDNPNVTVIVDRRAGPDRRTGKKAGGKRETRDRRRQRAPGHFFPPTRPNRRPTKSVPTRVPYQGTCGDGERSSGRSLWRRLRSSLHRHLAARRFASWPPSSSGLTGQCCARGGVLHAARCAPVRLGRRCGAAAAIESCGALPRPGRNLCIEAGEAAAGRAP